MSLSILVITNKKKLNEIVASHLNFGDELIISNVGDILLKSFAEKRNEVLKKAKGEWVLFVDDDEIVSRELADEIKQKIKRTKASGFFIPRQDVVFNEVLKFGETGKISILRLAKKELGKFVREVHEVWQVNGKKEKLTNPLYHIKDSFISEFSSRIMQYGPLDALSLSSEGKEFSYFKLLFYPKAKFLYNYFLKQGFLDGCPGLFHAYLMSVQSLSVRVYQWEKRTS